MKYDENLPLSEAVFFILLSLLPGSEHGYVIMDDERDGSDRERKAYILTHLGKDILEAETARMQSLVAMSQGRSSEGGAA